MIGTSCKLAPVGLKNNDFQEGANKLFVKLKNGLIYELEDDRKILNKNRILVLSGTKGVLAW